MLGDLLASEGGHDFLILSQVSHSTYAHFVFTHIIIQSITYTFASLYNVVKPWNRYFFSVRRSVLMTFDPKGLDVNSHSTHLLQVPIKQKA